MAVTELNEAPKMFGAYVESISSSIGWNGQGGSCQMSLVEDPDNDVVIDLPEVGTAAYFKYYGFYYGGIFQRWTYKEDIGGRKYDVILESPGGKILNGVNVILSNFEGTEFNEGDGYNKFNPSSNPNFTTQLTNIWNPYGHKENYAFGGRFGAANTNSAGFPARELLELLELISRGESDFGGKINFGESEYELNTNRLKEIPEFFRISGQSGSLSSILQECSEVLQYDFFADIEDKNGIPLENGGGVISNPVITIRTIDKTFQPDSGAVRTAVESAKSNGNLVSSDVGQELSDEVTQRIVVGGPASRYFLANTNDCIAIWGKLGGTSYVLGDIVPIAYRDDASVTIILDEMEGINSNVSSSLLSGSYRATVEELRMAGGGMESWQAFKVFQSVANGTYDEDPWSIGLDVDIQTLTEMAAGLSSGMRLASTSIATAAKVYDKDIKKYIQNIFNKVSEVATNFYGKMFLVPLPAEPGGLLNNLKFIEEDLLEVSAWEITDNAWVSNKPVSDVSFYSDNGRLVSTSVYELNSNYDYSSMNGDYAGWKTFGPSQSFSDGMATTKGGPAEDKVFYLNNKPYMVFDAGVQIKNYDSDTTPDFGITYLAKRFFDIDIPPERYISPGKQNTQIAIPPKIEPPKFLGLPQQSERYSWGPWYTSTSLNGKSEIVFDNNLAPETFGSVDRMNQAGQDAAGAGTAQIAASESGRIELAEFPAYSIADRFNNSGPYVTGMSINIGTAGITTSYEFNTWTPNFGKLSKYNADRVSRIFKATIAALKRYKEKNPKRPFKPIPFKKPDSDKQARLKENRTSAGFPLLNRFTNSHVEGDMVNISDAIGLAFPKINTSYGCSIDQQWSPVGTKAKKSILDTGIFFQAPEDVSEEDGGKFSNGVCPSSVDLDPYFSEAVFETPTGMIQNVDFVAVVNSSGGETTDFEIRKANEKSEIDEIRTVGLRGPLMLSGWGFDIAGNPAPSKSNDITKFNTDNINGSPAAFQREFWKTGPVNLMWDDERKVWSGGLDILSGILTSDISAPSSPTEPTTFTVNVLRKVNEEKGSGALETGDEIITCYNRDPSLSQASGSNVFVMIIRINYEWTPLWVGCP
jgi:hypothetical protein